MVWWVFGCGGAEVVEAPAAPPWSIVEQVPATAPVAPDVAWKAATDAGLTVGPDDPDVSGRWHQENPLGTWTFSQQLRRERLDPGLYAITVEARLAGPTGDLVRLSWTGFQALSGARSCSWVNTLTLTYPDESTRTRMHETSTRFHPDDANANPCQDVATLAVDRVVYTSGSVERRLP